MKSAYEIFAQYKQSPSIKIKLMNRMSCWKANTASDYFISSDRCVQQIEAILEKLEENKLSEDNSIEPLQNILLFTKKIVLILKKFQALPLSVQNSKAPFFTMSLDLIQTMGSYLSSEDIVKLNILCLLSHQKFQNAKDGIFKIILARDFPGHGYSESKKPNYFSFYKTIYSDSHCFLHVLFYEETPKGYSYTTVFEDNYLSKYLKINNPFRLYESAENLKLALYKQCMRGNQNHGYFLINMPINNAQILLNKGDYEALFFKVRELATHFVVTAHHISVQKFKVSYDRTTKKFINLNKMENNLAIADKAADKNQEPDADSERKCALM